MPTERPDQPDMKGLYMRVSEDFWGELDQFCKKRGLKKTNVLQEGFGLYKRRVERLEALAEEEDM